AKGIVDLSSKNRPPQRIGSDLASKLCREVPAQHGPSWYRTLGGGGRGAPQPFVISEEIGLVLPYRTADSSTELVAMEKGLSCVVEGAAKVKKGDVLVSLA